MESSSSLLLKAEEEFFFLLGEPVTATLLPFLSLH